VIIIKIDTDENTQNYALGVKTWSTV